MTAPRPAVGAPDWDTLAVELHCPRCGYDLRRLPQPRCPECGLQFRWAELIAATQERLQSPLFEQQWRHRPVRSFFGTIGRAMLPWLLWRQTRLVVEPRVGPLLLLVLPALLLHVAVCLSARFASDAFVAWWIARRFGRAFRVPTFFDPPGDYVAALLGTLVLVALTWAVLQVFQQTINRYRIRWRHFVRILALAGTSYLMWQAAAVALLCLRNPVAHVFGAALWYAHRGPVDWLDFLLPVSALALTVSTGMSRYLQVRGGWSMGFLSTGIVVLALVAPVTALTAHFGQTDTFWLPVLGRLWPGLRKLVWYVLVH
jgi:hypothetical protein